MSRITKYLAMLGLSLFVFLSLAPDVSALEDGDTVRIIVPYSPGGGYDSQARLAAPYIESALRSGGLPNVNVIVENVRGGGGAIATAMSYTAKPDGTLILFLDPESSIWQQARGNAQFEVDKFSFIAQMSIDPLAFIVRGNLGFNKFSDVIDRAKSQPILMGSSGKGGYDHIMPVILEKMLEDAGQPIKFDYLHLDGTAPILASMRRNEAEASFEVISTFGKAERKGDVKFLFAFVSSGPKANMWPTPESELKIPADQIALLAAAANYRRVFVGPPGMDSKTLEVVRSAFKAALDNPELIKRSEASGRAISFVGGDDIRDAVQKEAALAKKFGPFVEDRLK
jgi:tripartite-type tricarboxylate transporter receptor subunit TctC